MRADGVVVMPPAFDDDLSFPQRVEDLAVEQFVSQARIKTFDKAILPGAPWRDVGGLGSHGRDPILQGFCDELRAIVGTDMAKHAAQDEEIGIATQQFNLGIDVLTAQAPTVIKAGGPVVFTDRSGPVVR
jgi:hypothetical protein